jgi:hypothetical protein
MVDWQTPIYCLADGCPNTAPAYRRASRVTICESAVLFSAVVEPLECTYQES